MFDACGTITEALRKELVTVAEKQESVFGDVQVRRAHAPLRRAWPHVRVWLSRAAPSSARVRNVPTLRGLYAVPWPQLGVDVLADDLMWDVCKTDPLIKEGASEEEPEVREMHADGKFCICWDPLDGSSIVDNNWAVGTILGIWPASTGILGATGRDQAASMVALYGPRTTVFVTLDDGVSAAAATAAAATAAAATAAAATAGATATATAVRRPVPLLSPSDRLERLPVATTPAGVRVHVRRQR